MRKIYRTIDDVLRSPWGAIKHQDEKAAATDRVLRSTKLEDSIYADLRNDDPDLDQIEQAAAGKPRPDPRHLSVLLFPDAPAAGCRCAVHSGTAV